MFRLASLVLLVLAWFIGSWLAGPQMLPAPTTVLSAIVTEARSGELFVQLGITLARVFVAFTLAMTIGSAIGLLMGRIKLVDQLGDSWLVVLLNLPALVIIVLAYLWGGLTEIAAILAVAINKLPTAIVTVREGARALDPTLDEMAQVFALPRRKALRHPATRALPGGGGTHRFIAGVEDRAHRRTARPTQRRRVRDRHCVPAI